MKQEKVKSKKSTGKAKSIAKYLGILIGIMILTSIPLVFIPNALEFVAVPLILSQLAILMFGFQLIKYDVKYIKNKLMVKWKKKDILYIPLLLILIIIANSSISAIFGSFTSASTESVVNGSSPFLLIMAIIIAPLIEELSFRLSMRRRMEKDGFSSLAFVVTSSLIFGFLHWEPNNGMIIVTLISVMGALKALFYLKTENIWVPIFAHMLYNGFIIYITLL